MTAKILIVDDQRDFRLVLREKCEQWGYRVVEADTGLLGLEFAHAEQPDAVLLDLHLPDLSGLEVLERLKQAGHARAVIMITGDPQLEDAKTAIRLGAYDFIAKPLKLAELNVTLENALEAARLRTELESLRGEVRRRAGAHRVIGVSRAMRELMNFVGKVAASEASTILIQGESGTGKDLIAKTIHYQSARQDCPFVAINASAIPETLMEAELFGHEKGAFTDAKAMKKGLFEVADGGTIFLDEIGEISPFLQAKLLRVLEDQIIRRVGGVRDIQVNVRVIAASNRDLERAVRDGAFRQDLYYRLSIISVHLPPLREHREDILPLVNFFIEHYNQKFRKSVRELQEDARHSMERYDWPGNVRELKNAVERAIILEEGSTLRPEYLPVPVTRPAGAREDQHFATGTSDRLNAPTGKRLLPPLVIPEGGTSLEGVERALVELALRQSGGNQVHAAKLLDISRDALRYKMKKFGLSHGERDSAAASAAS